eukprot:197337-Rhodomonas_salina.1
MGTLSTTTSPMATVTQLTRACFSAAAHVAMSMSRSKAPMSRWQPSRVADGITTCTMRTMLALSAAV